LSKDEYRLISDSQWRYLHRKLNHLEAQVSDLRSSLKESQRPKRYLRFGECLPPASICKDVMSMMNGTNTYDGFIGRLAEYYHCETMGCFVDTNIDPKYAAVYRPSEKNAYSREKTVDRRIILHEFFHHLVNLNVVSVNKKDEEEYADKYARIVLSRGGYQ